MSRWSRYINFCRSTGYALNWRPLPTVEVVRARYLDGSDFMELWGIPSDVMIYFCRWLGYWPTAHDKAVRRAIVVSSSRLALPAESLDEGGLPWCRRTGLCPNGKPLPSSDEVRASYVGGSDFVLLYGYKGADVGHFCRLCGYEPTSPDKELRRSVSASAGHGRRDASTYLRGSLEWCRRTGLCPNGKPLPSSDEVRASYVGGVSFADVYGYTGNRPVNFCRVCGYEPTSFDRSQRKRAVSSRSDCG